MIFEEAKTVFNDPSSITVPDPDHSRGEDLWIDIVVSSQRRLLVVWYTQRDDRVRLIGCREATLAERRQYRNERIG